MRFGRTHKTREIPDLYIIELWPFLRKQKKPGLTWSLLQLL